MDTITGLTQPVLVLWAAATLLILTLFTYIGKRISTRLVLNNKPGDLTVTVPLQEKPQVQNIPKESAASQNHNRNNQKQSKKKQQQQQQQQQQHNNQQNNSKNSKSGFQHQLLAASLMGHTEKILDMDCSADGKYLVSCAEDRSVFFWDTKDPTAKGRKCIRVNIEYDHASWITWSPDSKAIIVYKSVANCMEVYKFDKKKEGLPSSLVKAITFDEAHKDTIVGFGIACNGKFMMTCSTNNDVIIWNLKGEKLALIDTYLMTTYSAKISSCARYVVASGFVGEVKIWEIRFDKDGEFVSAERAFELYGHSSGVYDFAFSAGTSRIATVSKDGTWQLFNTEINYSKGELPQLISSGKYTQFYGIPLIALSPRGNVIIISNESNLEIFNAETADLITTIENIFSYEISKLKFDPLGKYLYVCGGNRMRIFKNEFLK